VVEHPLAGLMYMSCFDQDLFNMQSNVSSVLMKALRFTR
jgi:hypothetical protein